MNGSHEGGHRFLLVFSPRLAPVWLSGSCYGFSHLLHGSGCCYGWWYSLEILSLNMDGFSRNFEIQKIMVPMTIAAKHIFRYLFSQLRWLFNNLVSSISCSREEFSIVTEVNFCCKEVFSISRFWSSIMWILWWWNVNS